MQEHTKLLRPAQVCEKLAISSTTLWRLIKSQKIKPPVKISSRCVVFESKSIENYIQSRLEANNDS